MIWFALFGLPLAILILAYVLYILLKEEGE